MLPGLRDMFFRIGSEYAAASSSTFKGHPLADFIRNVAPVAIKNALGPELSNGLIFKGSAGQSQWSAVPWIGVFYPVVTDSAQRGYYPVYLLNPTDGLLFLSMNQGATVVRISDPKSARETLKHRAVGISSRVPEFVREFECNKIELGPTARLPDDYAAGHAFGCRYEVANLPTEASMRRDLRRIVEAYFALEEKGDATLAEAFLASPNSSIDSSLPVIERNRRARHYRIERNPRAAKVAKTGRPAICDACGFDFSIRYGSLGEGYIEAHHLLPLGKIPEGKAVTYFAADFALLCANCHRMIHRLDDPSDLERLRSIIRGSISLDSVENRFAVLQKI